MKLAEICQQLDLEVKTETGQLDTEVTGGYATDLLSCAMAKSQAGNVWITLQSHPNVVAVASLTNLAGVIITEGMVPDEATIEKAQEEGVNIMTTPLTTYTVVGRLYALDVFGVD